MLIDINNWDLRIAKDEVLKKRHNMTCEEFINYHKDNIVIDLEDKIIVALASCDDESAPVETLAIFIPEGEKHDYKATLIYAGYIAFVKLEYKDGKVKYLIKDDECCPCDFDECIESGDILYCAEENGYTREDILDFIEKTIQVNYNYKFKIDKEKLIVLEGL